MIVEEHFEIVQAICDDLLEYISNKYCGTEIGYMCTALVICSQHLIATDSRASSSEKKEFLKELEKVFVSYNNQALEFTHDQEKENEN